jgi:hypothetical protein
MNKLIVLAVLLFVIIAVVALVVKSNPLKSPVPVVSNLKATFVSVGENPVIKLSYTNPDSFGPDSAKWKSVIFYLVECPNGNCPQVNDHPSPSDIVNQPNVPAGNFIVFAFDPPTVAPNKPSATVNAYINIVPDKVQLTNLKAGKTYKLGVSVVNDKKSMFGVPALTNVYGDFVYTTLVYSDPAGPGKVSNLTSNFV